MGIKVPINVELPDNFPEFVAQKLIDRGDCVLVVRCRDCKHRPTKPEKYADGFDLEFPDEECPCYCDDDPFYSWYPSDDWFCPRGEREGGDEHEQSCETCIHYPPSSFGGKPCCVCETSDWRTSCYERRNENAE